MKLRSRVAAALVQHCYSTDSSGYVSSAQNSLIGGGEPSAVEDDGDGEGSGGPVLPVTILFDVTVA